MHIESKRSKRNNSEYEIYVSLECENGTVQVPNLIKLMKRQLSYVCFDADTDAFNGKASNGSKLEKSSSIESPDVFDTSNSSMVNVEGVLIRKSNASFKY